MKKSIAAAFGFILTAQAQANPNCAAVEVKRVHDGLAEVEQFSRSRGKLAIDQPNLEKAREFLRGCSKEALVNAEETISAVYEREARPADVIRHLSLACRFSDDIEPAETRVRIEFDCYGALIPYLIEQDRFQEAGNTTGRLHRLAEESGQDTTEVVSRLLARKMKAVNDGKFDRARGFDDAIAVLAIGDTRTLVMLSRSAESIESHLALGEYGSALKSADEARQLIADEPMARRDPMALKALTLGGVAHLMMGELDRARDSFREAELLGSSILAHSRAESEDRREVNFFLAGLYSKRAIADLLARDPTSAKKNIEKAEAAAEATGFPGAASVLGIPRIKAQAAVDSAADSAEGLRQARTIIAQTNDVVGSGLLNLTENLMSNPTPAMVMNFSTMVLPGILKLTSHEEGVEIRARVARAWLKVGDKEKAIQEFGRAIDMIEMSRIQSLGSEALPAFFSRFIDIYGELVGSLEKNPEVALRYSEAAHARRFAEVYGPSLMKSFGALANVPDKMLEQERRLRENLGRASSGGLLGILDDPIAMRDKCEKAAKEYLEFAERMRAQYPRYAAAAFPRPVSLSGLPPELDKKYIVSYMVTDAGVYWWLLHARKIVDSGRAVILKSTLREKVKAFVPNKVENPAPELCEALVEKPFAKIAALSGDTVAPKVIVIPDDALYALPWDALCGLKGKSLGEEFAISYAPSLTVLTQAVSVRRTTSEKKAFVVGATQDDDVVVPDVGKFTALSPKPFKTAIGALQKAGYSAKILEGGAATLEALQSSDLSKYSLLHFDTHGFFHLINPPPSLILHSSKASPLGLLSLPDVAKLKLKARLVTLSACETAFGEKTNAIPGEGVEVMARLFMLAGAKAVLATLWKVHEDSSSELVSQFYKKIGAGDLASALFKSKAEVRAQYKYRDYWAPFILIGDPGD